MPLKKLSLDDNLGNNTSHFFKSGNLVRPQDVMDKMVEVRKLLPKNGPNSTRVEYDVWYDVGDPSKIHGYNYTDVLQRFIMLRVCASTWPRELVKDCISEQRVTEEGQKIIDDIANEQKDKYKLRKYRDSNKFVIFLPGSNCYDKLVDIEKCMTFIKKGAKLKMHPITNPPLEAHLRHTFGAENLINKKLSGHQVLEECETVGCCYNSEMGISGIIKGKNFCHIGKDEEVPTTYWHIYNGIFAWPEGHFGDEDTYQKRLLWFFSSDRNGMIYIHGKNPKEKINNFFNQYRKIPHVIPKSLNP